MPPAAAGGRGTSRVSDSLTGGIQGRAGVALQEGAPQPYKLTINSGSCGYGDIDPRLYPFYQVHQPDMRAD
jgi:hypothetical protein